MPGKRFKAEEIVNKLRQADVELDRGRGVQAAWDHGCHILPLAQGIRRDEGRPGEAPEGARAGERAAEVAAGGRGARQGDPQGGGPCLRLRETSEPGAPPGCGRGSPAHPSRGERAPRVPRARAAAGGAALHGACARRRRAAHRADRRAGIGVRPVRVATDHGNAAERGLEREPQAGGAHLEAGRPQGAEETASPRQAVAERRHLREAATSQLK